MFWYRDSNAQSRHVSPHGRSACSSPEALYDHLQCIGHTIKTTTRRVPTQFDRPKRDWRGRPIESAYHGKRAYNGDFNQEKDWRSRVAMARASIEQADNSDRIDHSERCLKMFMLPEFFFRGASGGYDMENAHRLIQELQQMVHERRFKD
jgi:hypothetical protein